MPFCLLLSLLDALSMNCTRNMDQILVVYVEKKHEDVLSPVPQQLDDCLMGVAKIRNAKIPV